MGRDDEYAHEYEDEDDEGLDYDEEGLHDDELAEDGMYGDEDEN